MAMMREPIPVARIITRLNIGGPAIQALTLTSRLAEHGFDTLLIHGQPDDGEGDMRDVLNCRPVPSVFIPSLRRSVQPLHDVRALWAIYTHLWRFRPRIVHTHTAKAGTLGRLATVAYNLTRGWRRPAKTVHTYHGHVLDGYFSPRMSAAFTQVERLLSRVTDIIVAISPRIRRNIEMEYRIGRAGQVRVVPLGFDLRQFAAIDPDARASARNELGLAACAPVITTVGRLTPIKQQHLFLAMAQRLVARHPATTFLIVGDGPLRQPLERQSRDLGLADHVRFLGWRSDLPGIYAATDVFVLTSANEGTPVALIEALASGVAGVSTDVGGVSDVLSGPDCGVLVPSGDVAQLTEAVSELLSNPVRRASAAAAGRASVISRFALDRLERDIVQLYRDLL